MKCLACLSVSASCLVILLLLATGHFCPGSAGHDRTKCLTEQFSQLCLIMGSLVAGIWCGNAAFDVWGGK